MKLVDLSVVGFPVLPALSIFPASVAEVVKHTLVVGLQQLWLRGDLPWEAENRHRAGREGVLACGRRVGYMFSHILPELCAL